MKAASVRHSSKWRVSLWALLIVVAAPWASELNAATVEHFYVSPEGDDAASGTSPEHPVASLAEVQRRMSLLPEGSAEIVADIAPGRHDPRTVVWKLPPHFTLKLVGTRGQSIFDGAGSDRYWATFDLSAPATRVVVLGVDVRNFRGAILIRGNGRDGGTALIEGNVFASIGQTRPGMKLGYSAVGIDRGAGNIVVDNEFIDIRNLDHEQCIGMHAIYLANGASENRISRNIFRKSCGEAIKVRNGSNGNIVDQNRFTEQTGAWFVDSFCANKAGAKCPKAECPSWGNRFIDNTGDAPSRDGRTSRILPVIPPTCAVPADEQRLLVE